MGFSKPEDDFYDQSWKLSHMMKQDKSYIK